jgi:hypothetical protein
MNQLFCTGRVEVSTYTTDPFQSQHHGSTETILPLSIAVFTLFQEYDIKDYDIKDRMSFVQHALILSNFAVMFINLFVR